MQQKRRENWWKQSTIYQIYPRSFQDSNGDGIGDLIGIVQRLDYLKDLGVDILWLSPIYDSPNDDNGYDISDYQRIMKEFGTMEDFERLLEEVHSRNMKLVMDMVVNHTSDEHIWFQEAKKSTLSPYRDYYIWKSGENGEPPNNWIGMFGGSTWEYDKESGQYYLHLFSKKQPDLNWDNPKVRESIYDIMNWWIDKGVDGFRMDVINFISKVPDLPNGVNGNGKPFFENGPRIHEFLQEINQNVVKETGVVMIGEMPDVTTKDAILYTKEERNELNMVFSFEHVDLGYGKYGKWSVEPWSLLQLKSIIKKWQDDLNDNGWNTLYWSNHDQPRAVSRFGNDSEEYREVSAKMLAICLHMLKGTPFIYQGEELGMTNTKFDTILEYKDIEILNAYNDYCVTGLLDEEDFMEAVYEHGRDNARVPMAWDDSENGGFTKGKPWIGTSKNYQEVNAKNNIEDPSSIYHFYKKLIKMRHQNEIMAFGSFEMILEDDENVFSYLRKHNQEKWLIVCNFKDQVVECQLPEEYHEIKLLEIIISNYGDIYIALPILKLRPYEALVLSFS